jgi:hypothetical protein
MAGPVMRLMIKVRIINALFGQPIFGIQIASLINGPVGGLGIMDGYVEIHPLIDMRGGGMSAKKTCKYCYGTGMIQCTTGWDGEMAVSCSCRQEGNDVKEDTERYIPIKDK